MTLATLFQHDSLPALGNDSSRLECAALFLSDIHLGSNQSQAKELSRFLKQIFPDVLYLIGDVLDFSAIKFNNNVDDHFLTETIDLMFSHSATDFLATDLFRRKKLLKKSHLQVLNDIHALRQHGVQVNYIPGNHDAYLRKYAGFEHDQFAIKREDIYHTPAGKRLLVRHGDEYDQVIQLHRSIASILTEVEEQYSLLINSFRAATDFFQSRQPTQSWHPEAILQTAVDMLAEHTDWPVPDANIFTSSGFSLAFTLEQAIKTHTSHDRVFKHLMTQHIFRVNRKLCARVAEGGSVDYLDGVVNGHTHIPEATAFESPKTDKPVGPCHITYYNDGSWARSQPHIGRTALVVGKNGHIGMIQFDKKLGIVPFQPPRFLFNTYPTVPCSTCGAPTAVVNAT